jgi:hypothetical protein
MQSNNKCGFCQTTGHTMPNCCNPLALFVVTEFHEIFNQNSSDPFVLLDWLNMVLLKIIKLIAHKKNVSRTGAKYDIIKSIMDRMFPNYPNPIWQHSQKQGQLLLSIMHKRTIQILSHQTRLMEIGIITEAIYSASSLHSVDVQSLNEIYFDFNRTHRRRYTDYLLSNSKHNIQTFIKTKETKEEDDQEADQDHNQDDCPICYEPITTDNEVSLNCKHRYCSGCIATTLKNSPRKIPTCALCRVQYSAFTMCSPVAREIVQPHLN